MKKLLTLTGVLVLAFGLTACSSDQTSADGDNAKSKTSDSSSVDKKDDADKPKANVNNSENKKKTVDLEDAKSGDKAVNNNDDYLLGYYKVVKVAEPNADISSGSIKATLKKVILAKFTAYEDEEDAFDDIDKFPIKVAITVVDAKNTSKDDNDFDLFGADLRTDDNKKYDAQEMLNTSKLDDGFHGKVSDHQVVPFNMKDVDLKKLKHLKLTTDGSMDGKGTTVNIKFE